MGEYAQQSQIVKFSETDTDYNSLKTEFIKRVVDFCKDKCINCNESKWNTRGNWFDYSKQWSGNKFDIHANHAWWYRISPNRNFVMQVAQTPQNYALLVYYTNEGITSMLNTFFTNYGIDLERHIATKDEFFGFFRGLIQFVSTHIVRVFQEMPPDTTLKKSLSQGFTQKMAYFLYNDPSASIYFQDVDVLNNTSNFIDILQNTLNNSRVIHLQYSITAIPA